MFKWFKFVWYKQKTSIQFSLLYFMNTFYHFFRFFWSIRGKQGYLNPFIYQTITLIVVLGFFYRKFSSWCDINGSSNHWNEYWTLRLVCWIGHWWWHKSKHSEKAVYATTSNSTGSPGRSVNKQCGPSMNGCELQERN